MAHSFKGYWDYRDISMEIIKFLQTAGIVAYPLLAFSLVAVALIIERLYYWFRVNRHQRKFVRQVFIQYEEDPLLAIKLLKEKAYLPIAKIFLEALELNNPNTDEFRLALDSATQAEIPTLKRFSTVFETIISVSPLLGLLGTILGLIKSFAALELGAAGESVSTNVTGGISEALVSTVMGLVVAIGTLLFANLFRSFYRRQLAFIQEYNGQLELIYRLKNEQGQDYANSR